MFRQDPVGVGNRRGIYKARKPWERSACGGTGMRHERIAAEECVHHGAAVCLQSGSRWGVAPGTVEFPLDRGVVL